MKLASWLLLLVFTFGSTGCAWFGLDETFRNRSNDYLRSEEMPHINVPDELDSEVVGELYPIPQGGQVATYQVEAGFEVPRPRSVAINDADNEVRIQRLGESAWILTSVPPGESWPLVRSFLTKQSIPTARADAGRGVIETTWFSTDEGENLLHQYLITLSQGVQLNTTEIDILHRSINPGETAQVTADWPSVSDDSERESWMRDMMAASLADENTLGTASLLGREIGAAEKVVLATPDDENPYIDMRLIFGRAWASVGYALVRDGFSITEQSIDDRVYTAEYLDPSREERSFFQKLVGANKPQPTSYRISLDVEDDEKVIVRVFDESGAPLNQRDSYIVLERIRSNLS